MSKPAPILSYATPEPQLPIYLAVILYLWAILDVLGGAFLIFMAFLNITELGSSTDVWDVFYRWISYLMFFLSFGLAPWGLLTFDLANQILQNQTAALRRAANLEPIRITRQPPALPGVRTV